MTTTNLIHFVMLHNIKYSHFTECRYTQGRLYNIRCNAYGYTDKHVGRNVIQAVTAENVGTHT